MGGLYPTPGKSGPGLSTAPGQHEFGPLLKQTPFKPARERPGHNEFTEWLKQQPFQPKEERPGQNEFSQWLKEQPFKPKEERYRPPSVPSVPYKLLPKVLKVHPALRALDWALFFTQMIYRPETKPGLRFPPGWYHHCGDYTAYPPGVCGYKYGTAPGHTVDCGTNSQVPAGDYPPASSVSVNTGASGAQFHIGRGHLACMRMWLDEVWRAPPTQPSPSIIEYRPALPPWFGPLPVLRGVPPLLQPPLTFAPPYPYPATETKKVPDRSPWENNETGPKAEESPQPDADPLPAEEPLVDFWPGPEQPPKPPFLPPGPGVKEKKFRFADNWLYQFATQLIGAFTEVSDFVDVLWAGLPPHLQAKYRNAGLEWKVRIIYDNMDKLDPYEVVKALIANEVEDRAYGAFGKKMAENVKSLALEGLYNSPKGLGFSLGV